jgi:hypothetical protein
MVATLARIEASQPVLTAFITVAADAPTQATREAERAVMSGARSRGSLLRILAAGDEVEDEDEDISDGEASEECDP